MITTDSPPLGSPHRSDDELLRLVDGEWRPDEIDAVLSHVESCDACRETVHLFHGLSGDLRTAPPPRAMPPVPTRRPRGLERSRPAVRLPGGGWLRAAVVVFGLVGLGMTVAPVRALVFRLAGIGPRPSAAGSSEVAVPDVPTPPPLDQPPTSTVSFEPIGDVLTVRLASSQPAGRLVLRLAAGRLASGAITGDRQNVSLGIAADGLRIDNRSTSTAGYEVGIPEGIARVIVTIGSGPARTIRRSELGAGGLVVGLWDGPVNP